MKILENHVADSGVTQAVARSSFTPGPWEIGWLGGDVIAKNLPPGKGPMKVCDIRGWGYLTGKGHGAIGLTEQDAIGIQNANARLIAAAPTLLEALVTFIEGSWESETQGGVVVPAWIFDRCADAIKLAVEERGAD